MRKTIAPGIRQDAYGFEAAVSVGSGKNKLCADPKRFPPVDEQHDLEHRIAEMQVWQARERLKLRDEQKRTGGAVVRGTLSADKLEYLRKADLTPDNQKDRERHLNWWIQTFPNRKRHTLTSDEIYTALKNLRTNTKPSRPAAANTKNHYRTALSELFVELDGYSAANPVRDVPIFDPPEELPRDQSYELIDLILANMPVMSSGKISRSRLTLRVLAYAPVTLAQLRRMSRDSARIDWTTGDVTTPGRRKGTRGRRGRRNRASAQTDYAGTGSKRKRWSADAIAALRDFDNANLWGAAIPSRGTMWPVFCRARNKAIAQWEAAGRHDLIATARTMRPYDLRHSYGSLVFRTTNGDMHATAEQLDHRNQKTTSRYAKGAIAERTAAVGAQVGAVMDARPKIDTARLLAGLPSATTIRAKNKGGNIQQNANISGLGRTVETPGKRAKTA